MIPLAITLFTLGIIVFFIFSLPQFGQAPKGKDKIRISKSKNFINKQFQNIGGIELQMSLSKARELFRQKKENKKTLAPDKGSKIQYRKKEDFQSSSTTTRVTWLGHSAFLLEIEGYKFLLDPMLAQSAAPFSFMVKRFNPIPIEISELPKIDAVIYSHDHYDHLDHRTVIQLKDKVDRFFTPLGVGSHLKKWGVAENKITELDWWNEQSFNGITLTCTPAQHFSGRTFGTKSSTLWCSWVIKSKTSSLFFNGDSGYFEGFKEIGDKYGPFDLCMLECGQYNKLWPEIHMTPEETVQANIDLKGALLMPIHWGTFTLSSHGWTESIERVSAAAKKAHVPLTTQMIGEITTLSEVPPNSTWWKA